MITDHNDLLTRQTEYETGAIVRDMGAATTQDVLSALVSGAGGGTAPIRQGTNLFIAAVNDANNDTTISFPLAPVGFEMAFQLTGAINSTFIIQENLIGVQQRIAGTATNFAARCADVGTDSNWTFTGTVTMAVTAGTCILILKKVRANTALTADGWELVSFQRQGS